MFIKRIISLMTACIIMLTSLMGGLFKKEDDALKNGYSTENLSSYTVPEWFRDAKFGIFIHYGVYSLPAFGDEWYGHHMYIPGSYSYGGDNIYDHHVATYGGAEKFGYKDFIPEFAECLKKFSRTDMAGQWAELFENAGAKYVMPVGIHHDSFALYASDVQKTYNSINFGGMDYIGELKNAMSEKGIKFGISNHFVENDWFFDDAYAQGTDLGEKNGDGSLVYGELYGDGKSKSSEHIHKWFDISMEIINKYDPDIIYYDFDLCNDELNKYSDANRYLMLANYYNHALETNPDGVVCCNKHYAFTQAQAVLDKERSALGDISSVPWQTDTSLGRKSWGYITNEEFRSGEQFIGALVDIVSKNGNLLLNVGPMADGTIPKEEEEALLTIGGWLKKYGDAIYCTRPWLISGEGPTQNTDDSFTYREGDIRFTRSKANDILYVTSLTGISGDTLCIKTLKKGEWDTNNINAVSLINGSERTALDWEQTENGLEIKVPDECSDEPFSLEITFVDGKIPPVSLCADKTVNVESAYEKMNVSQGHSLVDGSSTVISGEDGAYIKSKISFNGFEADTMRITVSGKNSGFVTVYDDSTDELIAKFNVLSTSSSYKTFTEELSTSLCDKDVDLRIEMSEGIELEAFGFGEKRTCNTVIDASRFDEKSGAVQSEPTSDPEGGGNSLGYVNSGDCVVYKNVDFGKGCTKLYLRAGANSGRIKVYVDKKIATQVVAKATVSTGSYDNYETLEVNMRPVIGKHDVYIEFVDGAINLNWFCVASKSFKLN